MRQKSGRLLTILFSAESIELQGQLCLIGIAKEITDRKQLELALQRSEAKLNHVLNSAIAAVTSIRVFPDGNWQYEYRSEGCEAVFGYTAQELMADPALWQSRVFPDDAAQVLELNSEKLHD
ncbi:MAG: PAS domain-containing protein [Hyellaceae cyanobacterium CSU_1_1]|nr:PAS domain-containing protein [Hyellaceae cyanobacterium CSU_1_1]